MRRPPAGGRRISLPKRSVLLDRLEHLEHALGRAVEEALVCLGQAAPLERVAADSFAFSHGMTPCSDAELYRMGRLRGQPASPAAPPASGFRRETRAPRARR